MTIFIKVIIAVFLLFCAYDIIDSSIDSYDYGNENQNITVYEINYLETVMGIFVAIFGMLIIYTIL